MDVDADQEGSSDYQTTIYSSESGTPAPSVYSYSSSRDGQVYLRELGGRTLNAKNDLYLLPAGMLSLVSSVHITLIFLIQMNMNTTDCEYISSISSIST